MNSNETIAFSSLPIWFFILHISNAIMSIIFVIITTKSPKVWCFSNMMEMLEFISRDDFCFNNLVRRLKQDKYKVVAKVLATICKNIFCFIIRSNHLVGQLGLGDRVHLSGTEE